MDIAIVGTRTFDDYKFMCEKLKPHKKFIAKIISGGAKGADSLAEKYAKENKIDIIIHRANWSTYGRLAGPIRNKLIVNDCEVLMAFWDGKSKGTKNSIDLAKKSNKILKIFRYD